MIRLVTYGNFQLMDLQIEEAYRRRRETRRLLLLDDVEDLTVLRSLAYLRRRSSESRDWLCRLAHAVDALAAPETGGARRRANAGRLVAVNDSARTSAGGGKRRRRSGR